MPAPPLSQMARTACVRNIRMITDVGDAPYENVRFLLRRVDNPDQLRQMEINSPQLCGHTAEIWMQLMEKNIPNWKTKPHEPSNPQNWHKVYRKLHREKIKEDEEAAKAMQASQDAKKTEKAQKTSKKVELSGVRLPSSLKREGEVIKVSRRSGAFAKESAQPSSFRPDTPVADRSSLMYSHQLDPITGHRVRAPEFTKPTPKSKMLQIKKEVMAMNRFPTKPKSGLLSTAYPKPVESKVSAPPSMTHEYRTLAAATNSVNGKPISAGNFDPKKRGIEQVDASGATDDLDNREKRLKALQNSSAAPRPSSPHVGTVRPPRIRHPSPDSALLTTEHNTDGTEDLIRTIESTTDRKTLSPNQPPSASGLLASSPVDRSRSGTPIGGIVPQAMRPPKKAANIFMPAKRKQRVC